MKKSVWHITALLILSLSSSAFGIADIQDDLSNYIKTGNSRELSKYFSASVTLAILGDEDVYTKAQAENLLKSFFAKNSPLSIKPLHKLSSTSSYTFTVLLLHTVNGDYRVSFSLKNINSINQITEMSIETSKE